MTKYRRLANAVAVFHWLWIGILLGGIPLEACCGWYRPIGLLLAVVTICSQVLWLGCPLVTLESALRRRYDPSYIYSGSFVCHCLRKYLHVEVPAVAILIALALVTAGSAVFLFV